MGQLMCMTAANSCSGVAVGSSIGHAVGGWFGGNSGVSEAQNNGLESQQVQDGSNQNRSWTQESCEPAAKGLTSCLDQNNGNMQICTWYLDQLVSCCLLSDRPISSLKTTFRNLAKLQQAIISTEWIFGGAADVKLHTINVGQRISYNRLSVKHLTYILNSTCCTSIVN